MSKWFGENVWSNPEVVLLSASERSDVVQGLIPERGVTWLYGPSMSFKSFIAMDLAVAVSARSEWLGKRVEDSIVVYVGAEGGDALHVRRAAAEAGVVPGLLLVLQERPQLDTPQGVACLRAIFSGLFGLGEDTEDGTPEAAVAEKYASDEVRDMSEAYTSIVCIIDTYSQTSSGDDKFNVALYIKALRDMIETADQEMWRLSFVVVDHATKAGGSYIGSVAKLNDVDSQLEVAREGASLRATIHHRKAKDGPECEPIPVEMVNHTFEYCDAYGDPLKTLVVRDGTRAAKLAEIADGKAGTLLALLPDDGRGVEESLLRDKFLAHPTNSGLKQDSAGKAWRRAKSELLDIGAIEEEGGVIRTV
jgi:hypothetical protein